MRVILNVIFYTVICDAIFGQLEAAEEQREEINRQIRKPRSRQDKSGFKKRLAPFLDGNANEFLQNKRNVEQPYPKFYLINNPDHVGDEARLRLDFIHPAVGGNGSCPNFRGSAEVVAGRWRLPPELNPGKDWDKDIEPQFTTTASSPPEKPGFFKGVENFFRHSFHMDKTTASIRTTATTEKEAGYNPTEATTSSLLHQPLIPLRNTGNNFLKTKRTSRGRDATFNLRIKAVAIRKLQDTRGA